MAKSQPKAGKKRCVVIVGAGFAGFNAARELSRLVGATTEIVVINSTDYFLYLPLMPQVSGGLVEPRHICVSLPRRLPKVRFVLGTVTSVDPRQKVVTWSGPEGTSGAAGYALVGLGGLIFASVYLRNFLPLGAAGHLLSAGMMPINSVAVGLEVTGAFLVTWTEFLDQTLVSSGRTAGRG